MRNKLFVIGALCLQILPIYSQLDVQSFSSKVVNSNNLIQNVSDQISKDSRSFTFYGFGQDLDENVLLSGFKIFDHGQTVQLKSLPLLNLDNTLPTYFYFNIYSQNVDTIYVKGITKNNKNIDFRFPISAGYFPIEIPLEFEQQQKIMNSRLVAIEITNKQNLQKDIDFVLGDLQIYQRKIGLEPAKVEFLYELTQDRNFRPNNYQQSSKGNALKIENLTSFKNFSWSNFEVNYSPALMKSEQEKQFWNFIDLAFQRYPFYQEHQLDSLQFSQELLKIENQTTSYTQKLTSLQSLINQFYDPHFRLLLNKKNEKRRSPIYAYQNNEKLLIASVFANELTSVVKPDMQIDSINGVPIQIYVDSLAQFEYGNESQRRELAISKLFALTSTDTLKLQLIDSNNRPQQVEISGRMKMQVPIQFRTQHYDFQVFSNDIGYLKINSWTAGDWIRFVNLVPKIKNLKGLIIDLRGNGGGEEREALRLASCFIDKPSEYAYNSYNKIEFEKATTLYPNPFIQLSDIPVRILVNYRTACSSESFIYILKNYTHNTQVIGAQSTAGAYAGLNYFLFPNDVLFATCFLEKLKVKKEENPIEYVGISPDIKVLINSYKDLYGYEDKVLQTAINRLEKLHVFKQ